MTYRNRIQEITSQFDPRHIEAYMRVAYSTLDGLSPSKFEREVRIAAACIVEGGKDMAERIAQSFGI